MLYRDEVTHGLTPEQVIDWLKNEGIHWSNDMEWKFFTIAGFLEERYPKRPEANDGTV